MCQIISVPAGKEVNMEHLDAAQEHNKDGYGVAWYEDNVVKTYKTMNYEVFKGVLKVLTPYTKIVHLRYNTVGKTNLENCHPFNVPNGVMFHNGTITALKPAGHWDKKTNKYVYPNNSDSYELAKLLNDCWYDSVVDIEPLLYPIIGTAINKLAFLEKDGTVTLINEQLGIEEDGIWYSNDYHIKKDGWCRHGSCAPKKETTYSFDKETKQLPPSKPTGELLTKVFVYGTLKRGHSNSHLLKAATFLGKAHTITKWAMVGKGRGFPYVVEVHEEGFNVQGEVYEVNTRQLYLLDQLEGIESGHYKKVLIGARYNDTKKIVSVTMYVACNKPAGYATAELLEEWTV